MKKNKKNEIICITIILLLSLINIFSNYIGKFILNINTIYKNIELEYTALNIITRSFNFTYIGLVIFTIYYFLIYKKNN